MKIIRLGLMIVMLLLISVAAASDDKSGRADPITIALRLDKTAIWVGDILTYNVRVIYDQNIEFVLGHLKEKEFSLAPFIIRSITFKEQDRLQNKRLLEIGFLLSSYEVGKTELTIPAFSLYYFRKDRERMEDALAEAVKVPAVGVGMRSTLDGRQLRLRDSKSIADVDLSRAVVFMALSLLGLSFLSYLGIRRIWASLRPEKVRKWPSDMKSRENLAHEILAKINSINRENPEELIPFYTEISHLLRQYLSHRVEADFSGLTPEEIETFLDKSKFNGDLARQIRTVLDQCDRVRYGRDGDRLGRDLRPGVSEAVIRILGDSRH